MFGFVVLTATPMVWSLILSFTDYSIITPSHNVGLQNYRDLYHDPKVAGALKNVAIYSALHVPGVMLVSLGLAMLLARIGERSGGIHPRRRRGHDLCPRARGLGVLRTLRNRPRISRLEADRLALAVAKQERVEVNLR